MVKRIKGRGRMNPTARGLTALQAAPCETPLVMLLE